ncbi:MAG TPA: S-methyl-5'-thioadenosine phosphorylase [Polyangia bacterium]|nr:S-methyl-5'-thioadenosine phosphorylase [Polyangia bacterium]
MSERVIGVIGGSGLYEMEGLTAVEQVRLTTPFGEPSDEYVVGRLGDARLVFLPRHGRGHRILPHEINFPANVHGMKQLGVEWIISVSAVGSMKEQIHPGDIVIVDQFIDRTKTRAASFFGRGVAGHVGFADPICGALASHVYDAAVAAGARAHQGGTYVVIDGPMFSTRAESRLYRSWGVDVIGMTNLPEAKLAREAELCYSTVALATDYDCWHEAEEDVTVEAVMAIVRQNVELAKSIIRGAVARIPAERECPCKSAAQHAVMTAPDRIGPVERARLEAIMGKYWSKA